MKAIKGFLEIGIGTLFGAGVMNMIGNAGSYLGEGIKGASQSLVGAGILANNYNAIKGMFKFK